MGFERLIDGRWALGELLGVGGGGRVWAVTDKLTGQQAALKLVRAVSDVQRRRVLRETAALRTLQIPGVVRLLATGEHLDEPYIVMERLDGAPFPGAGVGRDLPRLIPRVLALADTLAELHRRGIVHRDLKPSNVLVSTRGEVTVLDFGLARGSELASTITATGTPVGTPRYLSPEQLLGLPVDGRTDLYSLGVMLYEIFAGLPPLPDEKFAQRWLSQVVPPIAPLAEVAPATPPRLARIVDALLAPRREDRPDSAATLRRLLDGLQSETVEIARARELPFLGRGEVLARVRDEVLAGRSPKVWGARGMGRSRFLSELARALRAQGREVAQVGPGTRPLQSFASLLGEPKGGPDALVEMEARLRARVESGLVLLVDDGVRIDPWSASLLARVAAFGACVRVVDSPDALVLAALDEDTLAQLFHGPSRVLHLPEDAAACLYARTAGVPARVAIQVGAWVSAGLARWDGDRLRIDRPSLDRLLGGLEVGGVSSWTGGASAELDPVLERLLAWIALAAAPVSAATLAAAAGLPDWEVELELEELLRLGAIRRRGGDRVEALSAPALLHDLDEEERVRRHRALAAAWPATEPGRLHHLLVAGEAGEAVAEGLRQSAGLRGAGRASQAAVMLLGVWSRVRPEAAPALAEALLRELVRATLEGTTSAQRLEAEAALAEATVPSLAPLAELLRVSRLAAGGQLAEAEAAARDMAEFEDAELEAGRVGVIARSLVERRDPDAAPFIEGYLDHRERALRARAHGWLGLLRYEEERFAEAAALQEEAAGLEDWPYRRLHALVNRGSALLESDPGQVGALGLVIAEEGAALRLPRFEVFGHHLHRAGHYRLGLPLALDEEWITLSELVGESRRHAHACLVEAAIAWRSGLAEVSARLADTSARLYREAGLADLAVLPESLAALCRDRAEPGLFERATKVLRPRYRVQIWALLNRLTTPPPGTASQLAAAAACVPAEAPPGRWDVIDFPGEVR